MKISSLLLHCLSILCEFLISREHKYKLSHYILKSYLRNDFSYILINWGTKTHLKLVQKSFSEIVIFMSLW